MKQSTLAKRQIVAKAREMENAANVYRVAMADTLGAEPGEPFRDALLRTIDERIAAEKSNRWYHKLFTRIVR